MEQEKFEEYEKDNQLINLCLCKGSCEYIHLGCLKAWINFNLIIKN